MERIERCDIFCPTAPQQHLLLDLLQRADCSLEDIAEALRTSVAALTVYLASDDAIEILAQAELSNARRGRLAATAQLDKCAHALSLILDGYISDTTTAVRRDTPKNRREDLIHQESARRAATQLFKIANFTPRVFTATRLLSPRERGEVPESSRAVRGPDATERQPASVNAPSNRLHDGSGSLSPDGGREGVGEGRIVSKHALTTPPAAPVTRLLAPRQHKADGADSVAAGHTSEGADAADLQPPSTITTDARDLEVSNSSSHDGAKHRDHRAPSRARDAPSASPCVQPATP